VCVFIVCVFMCVCLCVCVYCVGVHVCVFMCVFIVCVCVFMCVCVCRRRVVDDEKLVLNLLHFCISGFLKTDNRPLFIKYFTGQYPKSATQSVLKCSYN